MASFLSFRSGAKRALVFPAVAVLSFLGSALLEPQLRRRGEELGILPRVPEGLSESLRESRVPDSALAGATLGVFRPILINFLWVRSLRLQRQGELFEAASLADAITTLQPRLPEVWVFQARTLAYEVSAAAPLEHRFEWVLQGIRLLRDRGLRYNPESLRIRESLVFLFLHRIGSESGEAHFRLKDELALLFEPRQELGPRERDLRMRETLERWKLDERLLESLAARYATTPGPLPARSFFGLDPRSAHTHALFWSETGLALLSRLPDRTGFSLLRDSKLLALSDLLSRGLVLRQPGGRHHAFLPDLRFRAGMTRAYEEYRKALPPEPRFLEEVERFEETVDAWTVLHLALWNRREEAREAFESLAYRGGARSLTDFVARSLEPEGGFHDQEQALALIGGVLEASVHLRLVEGVKTGDAADGAAWLAGVIHRRWDVAHPDASFPSIRSLRLAILDAVIARLSSAERTRPLSVRLEARLEEERATGGERTDETPSGNAVLPSRLELPRAFRPLRLEALDPLFDGEAR